MQIYRKVICLCTVLFTMVLQAVSLKTVYDAALPQNGFDRWLELETGVTYTGGLLIGQVSAPYNSRLFGQPGQDVKIRGNGAVLDLQGGEIAISFCKNRLEIENCVIINGNVRYRGDLVDNNSGGTIDLRPVGAIRYVTFYNAHDFGIRVAGAGSDIVIWRNIFFNTIDTGVDYSIYNGAAEGNLPTGIHCAFSANYGAFGYPQMLENWTYHSRESYNNNPLYNFGLL